MNFQEISVDNSHVLFALQSGQHLSQATPPGGHLTLWAGWSLGVASSWFITRSCRRLFCRSFVSSQPSWMSASQRRGCCVHSATKTDTSNAQGVHSRPLTRSPLTWNRWLTPLFTLLIRPWGAETSVDFQRITVPQDDVQTFHSCSRLMNLRGPLSGTLWSAVGSRRTRTGHCRDISYYCSTVTGHEAPTHLEDLKWFLGLQYFRRKRVSLSPGIFITETCSFSLLCFIWNSQSYSHTV